MKFRQFVHALTLVALIGFASAQPCTWEVEPNDKPHLATPLTDAGPTSALPSTGDARTLCLAGELTGGDQDMFVWDVPDEHANQRWAVDLYGTDGILTRLDLLRLTFLDDGESVTSRTDLLTVETMSSGKLTSPEFVLEPGRYYLGLSKAGGDSDYVVHLRPTSSFSSGAQPYREGSAREGGFTGRGSNPGELEQEWTLAEEEAAYLWTFTYEAPLGTSASLSLTGPDGPVADAQTGATGEAQLREISLAPGAYTLRAAGDASLFRLSAKREGRRSDGVALKPDDNRDQATHFPVGTEMRSTLTRQDWFRIVIDEEQAAQAWTLTLEEEGNGLHLDLETESGTALLDRRNATGHVADLSLEPGVYYLKVSGENGLDYKLALSATEHPSGGYEVEPNDTVASATPLSDELQVRGDFSSGRDTDVFSFDVNGEATLYRVQLISQGSGTIALLDRNGRTTGSAKADGRTRLDNLALEPGTHYVSVSGHEGEYALRLLPLGPLPEPPAVEDLPAADELLVVAAAATPQQPLDEAVASPTEAELPALPPPPPGVLELEPNNERSRANRLLPGVPRVGTLHPGDEDVYRFYLAEDQPVRIELVPPEDGEPLRFDLSEAGRVQPARSAEPGTPTVAELWLKAGDHYVTVKQGTTGDAWYQLRLTLLNGALPISEEGVAVETGDAAVAVKLGSDHREVAAYLNHGQSLTTTAEITNTGDEAATVTLSSHLSDARFSAEHPSSVEVGAGESVSVPVTLTLPADLRDDVPVQIALAATTEEGSRGAKLSVPAVCQAPPVLPRWHWPVPEPLLGGIDVLWAALGAEVHADSISGRSAANLVDGRASPAYDARIDGSLPTYRVAGEGPTELVGALLHPMGIRSTDEQLKGFRLEVSLDGEEFRTVHEGELRAARVEQAVVFNEPVMARYVRLVPLDNQAGRQHIRLGELKVISSERAPLGRFDLADPAVGGHVVWTDPSANRDFLRSHRASERVDLRGTDEFSFVLAFHNSRAALIASLEWGGDQDSGDAPFEQVSVDVSLTGAAGPWEPLADWEFKRDEDGRATLELEEPTWARYLRFTARTATEDQRRAPLPRELTVWEAEAGGDYYSILGEWGMASPLGIYEELNPPKLPDYEGFHEGNGSRNTAITLAADQVAEGTVLLGENEAWYELVIAEGHNHLSVRLEGEPLISYAYEVTDSNGEQVRFEEREDAGGVTLSFNGAPGAYLLRLHEPKRNVIFSWDTSPSMGPYLDITYNVLASFAAAIDGERESVQLLAYDKPSPVWLLPRFSSDREEHQRAVTAFDRSASSSNSEQPIIMAADALAERNGARALLLVTDAETTGTHLATDVWRALERTRLRIFTFEVNSYGSLHSQQYMQDWALANSGHYALATTIGDLEMGHDRAACLLSAPKHYRVSAKSSSEVAWESASAWAEPELDRAVQLDLIPDALKDSDLTGFITRAEFAGVAVKVYEKLAGVTAEPASENPFVDTDDPDVLRAFNMDLAVGISETEFEPGALLNREQAATILTRVVKKYSLPGWTWDEDADYELAFVKPEPFADDEKISPWARDSVYFMAANGIITGIGGNEFGPRAITPEEQAVNYAGATREQALVLAVRMVENLGGESGGE